MDIFPVEQWNDGIVPVKPKERPGTREDSGFVNRAVNRGGVKIELKLIQNKVNSNWNQDQGKRSFSSQKQKWFLDTSMTSRPWVSNETFFFSEVHFHSICLDNCLVDCKHGGSTTAHVTARGGRTSASGTVEPVNHRHRGADQKGEWQ